MPESYESYEVYVSPAGIRVCSGGWDQAFIWDKAGPGQLEDCWGHETGPEAVMAGRTDKPEGTQDND